MRERIHQVLDGELPRSALSPAERAELAALEATIAEVAGELRSRPTPELTARVMQALPAPAAAADVGAPAAARRGWARAALGWLWTPRPLQLRPAYALAAVLAALALGVWAPLGPRPAGVPAGTAAEATPLFVQFRIDAAGARHVALAGSFSGWEPRYELHETSPGVWSVLVPLPPGVHDYAFVIDGAVWVPDPHAPQVDDSFGGRNSRLALLPPTGEV